MNGCQYAPYTLQSNIIVYEFRFLVCKNLLDLGMIGIKSLSIKPNGNSIIAQNGISEYHRDYRCESCK
jgi:hypothetical protein